ncbi:MAG: hypothetical protein M1114_02605 [Candidatus Dependentiae bacterium]|nr:hypothetical protein [Candidatus Dependentiae bacterium]
MTTVRKDGDYATIHVDYYDKEIFTEETIPYLRIHRDEFAHVLRESSNFIERMGKSFSLQ